MKSEQVPFWFFPLQDVLLSDKKPLRSFFVGQSQSCPGLRSVPPRKPGSIVNSQLVYSYEWQRQDKGQAANACR